MKGRLIIKSKHYRRNTIYIH